MPATIPSHQAAVLPLKLLRPNRFDGVALVVGSIAPDFPYVFAGYGIVVHGHAWHSLLWYAIPVTVLVAALVRRAAPVVAAHLPAGGPLALRDYGVLGTVRHPLGVTAASAMLGAFSHIAWDTFTHPHIVAVHPFLGGSTSLPAMQATAFAGLAWWRVIQLFSELVGSAVTLATIIHIGRRRLLVAWHGPAPQVPRRPALFWAVAVAAVIGLLALAAALPGNHIGPHVIGTRVIGAAAFALLAASAVVAIRTKFSPAPDPSPAPSRGPSPPPGPSPARGGRGTTPSASRNGTSPQGH